MNVAKPIIKTYKGTQAQATAAFQADSEKMARQGYRPISQSWAPGAYGCGDFVVALLLCLVLIGFIVFIYMLLVKPAGTLTVTYEFVAQGTVEFHHAKPEEKTCPQCAESVKAAALICRYCGYKFGPTSEPPTSTSGGESVSPAPDKDEVARAENEVAHLKAELQKLPDLKEIAQHRSDVEWVRSHPVRSRLGGGPWQRMSNFSTAMSRRGLSSNWNDGDTFDKLDRIAKDTALALERLQADLKEAETMLESTRRKVAETS